MIVVPGLHPAALLRGRDSDDGLSKYEMTTIEDIRKAFRMSRERPRWDERAIYEHDAAGRTIALFPTVEEVEQFCAAAEGFPLALDTETTGESTLDCKLLCCGFASANGSVMCVPFLKRGGARYWAPWDEQRVRAAVGRLLGSKTTSKVIHNKSFDKIVLWANGLAVDGEVFDTMQAHHCVDAELPHGLGYCGTRHLDIRYWKDDVKGDEGWIDIDETTLRLYNLRDCLVALRLAPIFAAELTKYSLWPLFHEEQALTDLMARATIRGLSIDYTRRDGGFEIDPKTGQQVAVEGLGPMRRRQMNAALQLLRYVAGSSSFDPMKPAQLRWLLFDRLRLPIVKMAKSGAHPSTDKEAMVLLALAADNDWQRAGIKGLADFRSAQKDISTFIEGLPILGDGALHVSWKLLTVSGRFASSPNAQNWGKRIKAIFKARPGFKFVGVDLSQAELRAIAYFANDRRLLDMYARGLNIHTVNLAMSLRARPPIGHKDLDPATEQYIRDEMPKLLGPAANFSQLVEMKGNALKGARTLIKNDTFGRNYGAIEETVFSVLRSKRDPDTNELLFPGLKRSEVEANGVMWRKLNVDIVKWWGNIQASVKAKGYYQDPFSGRMHWFRAGFKQNDILNRPIQGIIASIVNRRALEIQKVFDAETNGVALIAQQVHDSFNSEVPEDYAKRACVVKDTILSQPVALPGHPQAMFPPDPSIIGTHLDQV